MSKDSDAKRSSERTTHSDLHRKHMGPSTEVGAKESQGTRALFTSRWRHNLHRHICSTEILHDEPEACCAQSRSCIDLDSYPEAIRIVSRESSYKSLQTTILSDRLPRSFERSHSQIALP